MKKWAKREFAQHFSCCDKLISSDSEENLIRCLFGHNFHSELWVIRITNPDKGGFNKTKVHSRVKFDREKEAISSVAAKRMPWLWIEHRTFRSSVWRSPNWAIKAGGFIIILYVFHTSFGTHTHRYEHTRTHLRNGVAMCFLEMQLFGKEPIQSHHHYP